MTRDIECKIKYSVSDTFGSDSVFSLIKFTLEVKETTTFCRRIKHGLIPSL